MKQAHILVVEDEDVTRFNLVQLFIAEGYTVSEATDGESMHEALQANKIQLVVMDINLPGTNGLILAKELINSQDIALIFLTGRDADIDKVLGLEIGADDYITKPFNPRELTIRVRNILNRFQEKPLTSNAENLFSFNEWKLDGNARVMTSPTGQSFAIPRGEYRALTLLIENAGNIVTRKELLFAMTGRDLKAQDRTVDVTIRRLRKHFESVENSPELIHTIHGEGYRFVGTLD